MWLKLVSPGRRRMTTPSPYCARRNTVPSDVTAISLTVAVMPLAVLVHRVPSQWNSSPFCAPIQTSLLARPRTLHSAPVVSGVDSVHALPFQCATMPLTPTAHTSFAAAPQTARKLLVVTLGTAVHVLP